MDVSVKPARYGSTDNEKSINQLSKRNLNTVRDKEQLSNGLNKVPAGTPCGGKGRIREIDPD